MSERIRALIVDDEPPARAVIRSMVDDDPDIEIVGECSNGNDAIEKVAKLEPDLLFLDIEMPEKDGLAVVDALQGPKTPAIIFVTAYDQYAVKAFDLAAVDYLLKPFDHDRMAVALDRAKSNLRELSDTERNNQLVELLRTLTSREDLLDRFVIKKDGRVLLLPVGEVDWIEACGNYVILHTADATHIVRETMKQIGRRLDPKQFVRIHRSTTVNLGQVRELQVHFNEEHLVILKNGKELTLSRRYREKLSQKLGASI
ncbi:MAG: LytR/AlgR family response regulator transcription factor [Pyrinomonadaceae bacterium]